MRHVARQFVGAGFDEAGARAVAPEHADGLDSSGFCGFDVEPGVAHHDGFIGRNAEQVAGMRHGGWVGFEGPHIIVSNDCVEVVRHAEVEEELLGLRLPLRGHDARAHPEASQVLDEVLDAFEEVGQEPPGFAVGCAVAVRHHLNDGSVLAFLSQDETQWIADESFQFVLGKRGLALLQQDAVHGLADRQVGIQDRAVDVEEDGLGHRHDAGHEGEAFEATAHGCGSTEDFGALKGCRGVPLPLAFTPSPAYGRLPPRTPTPEDPRFLDLLVPDAKSADILLAGLPYDGAVIGRKGCKDGPEAIREAFRYLGSWDADRHAGLKGLRIHDLGNAPIVEGDTLATHALAGSHLAAALKPPRPLVVLGGDNSLSYPTFQALHDAYGGRWGLLVLDAHYDLRAYTGQPTSGTPYRRILTEVPGKPVQGGNLVEIGIRPYANASSLAEFAREQGVVVFPMGEVRERGIKQIVRQALAAAGNGVDHLFLSVDIDGLDQSIASGCSAPGAGGLTFDEAAHIVHEVASDPRTRAMDLVEVAPNLDPTGNTARTAAQLVATFAGAVAGR